VLKSIRDWFHRQYFEDDLFGRVAGFYIGCLVLLALLFVIRFLGNDWISTLPETDSILAILGCALIVIWALLLQTRALLPKSSGLYSLAASLTPRLPGWPPDLDSDFLNQFVWGLWLVFYVLLIPAFLVVPALKQLGIRGGVVISTIP
jgi:hypothetical protein